MLTDDQTTKISAINLKCVGQRKTAIEEAREAGDFSGVVAKLEGTMKVITVEILPLLTGVQKPLCEKLKKKIQGERRGGGMRPSDN